MKNKTLDRAGVLPFLAKRAEKLNHLDVGKKQRPYKRPNPRWFAKLSDDGQSALYAHPQSGIAGIDQGAMSVDFKVSSSRRDRHGDIVIPKGCLRTLENYKANPRNFFAHRSQELPISSCRNPSTGDLTLWVADDEINARFFFHCKTQLSEDVFTLCCLGELQSTSISFQPFHAKLIEGAEQSSDQTEVDFDLGGLIFDEWDLLEISVVPIPANPDATRAYLSSKQGQRANHFLRKALLAALPPVTLKSTPVSFSETKSNMADSTTASPSVMGSDTAEADKENVQALIFHPAQFPDEETIRQWLGDNGYNADSIHPGEEADEPWVAIQFGAQECEVDSAKREEVEPGVEAVVCQKQASDEDEQEKPEVDQTTEKPGLAGDAGLKGVDLPRAPWKVLQESKAGPKLPKVLADDKKKKPDEEEEEDEEESEGLKPDSAEDAEAETESDDLAESESEEESEEKKPEEQEEEETEEDDMPHGAKVLSDMYSCLLDHHQMMEKAYKKLDEGPVKKFVSKLKEGIHKHVCELHDFASESYPDHFKGEAPPENTLPAGKETKKKPGKEDSKKKPGKEDAKDKPEKGALLSVRTKLAQKDLAVLGEAQEFLEELAEEENLKKSQKAACRLHGSSLKGLGEKYLPKVTTTQEQETSKQLQVALQKLLQERQQLKDKLYALTGAELS